MAVAAPPLLLHCGTHLHQVQRRQRAAGGTQAVARPGRPAARLHTCQLLHPGPPLLFRQLAPQQVVLWVGVGMASCSGWVHGFNTSELRAVAI